MDELISKQAAIDALRDKFKRTPTNAIRAMDAVKQLPPAQKKGHWIDRTDDGYLECPFCGSATNCEDNREELHYCFSCGSRLE